MKHHHLSICAIVKNEYDYLLEWIAYHQVVGTDHFLIYNNSEKDDDGTTKLLNRLKKLRCIEVVPWPDKPKWVVRNQAYNRPQVPAYLDGLKRLRRKSDWVAFIDVDEFIVPMKEPDLPSTLKLYQQFGGVGANWLMFGFSGEKTKKNLPVCSRFTRAAAMGCPNHRHVKCIVKPELVRAIGVHRPVLKEGLLVDERGNEITNASGIHDNISYDVIRINHYYTKSHEEWLEKVNRGRADHAEKKTEHGVSEADFNDEDDTFILKFYGATVERMRALASEAKINNYPCLSEDLPVSDNLVPSKQAPGVTIRTIQKVREFQPVVDVFFKSGFANRMIQYMVARRIAEEVEGCRISNVAFPEWGINHPVIAGGPETGDKIPIAENSLNIEEIERSLSSGKRDRFTFRSYAQWFPNFPHLNTCQRVFPANQEVYPGYGPEYLVCNVRGEEVLDAIHPSYTLLPIEFYAELANTTGLKPVFMGQIADNAYCNALRRRFPDAVFEPTRGALADFQTLRNSKNIVVAVSTFSWLAAWLSHADLIVLPVNGLFHPVQCPEVDLLPVSDARYRFYLFPINYSLPLSRFEEAHRALRDHWRYMPAEEIAVLRAKVTRKSKRCFEKYLAMFDEKYYLQTYPDIVRAVQSGSLPNGRHHYARAGFKENRLGFPFDARWYCVQYPLAALEVGQGDYLDLRQHYVEVGAMRGYKPYPDAPARTYMRPSSP
jgi:hypothetical protein